MATEMDRDLALRILSSRVVAEIGAATVCKIQRISSITSNSGMLLNVIDTNLVTQQQLLLAQKAFKEGRYNDACNERISYISAYAPNHRPFKGEVCSAQVELGKDGRPYAVSFQPMAPAVGQKVSSAMFTDEVSVADDIIAPVEQPVAKGAKVN